MPDTLLYVRVVYPDGTMETRQARVAPDGNRQIRLNFHDGKLGRASELKQLRMSPTESIRPGLKPVAASGLAAGDQTVSDVRGGSGNGDR